MVWAGICHGHNTSLIFIECTLTVVRYRGNLLAPLVLPFVQRDNVIYQQDNTRPHVQGSAETIWQPQRECSSMDSIRPGLSAIQHVRDILDMKLRARHPPP